MILTGHEINCQYSRERIKIVPYSEDQITTNSYDLRLGEQYIRYLDRVIDPKKPSKFELLKIPQHGLKMNPGDFILSETSEWVGSNHYVPIIHAKSGTARCGLFVHVTADLIDIGSYGKITLQLYATLPVIIYPNMLIAQVSFWQPTGEISLYRGKYQNSANPIPSLTYKDYCDENE